MTDPGPAASATTTRCPWCSTAVAPGTAKCPNCGAQIGDVAVADIPGVTQIDPTATVVRPQPRGRGIIGWLSGEVETSETDLDRAGIEPPSDAVRQEMVRLEMEALKAEIEAEAAAQAAAGSDDAVVPAMAPAAGQAGNDRPEDGPGSGDSAPAA